MKINKPYNVSGSHNIGKSVVKSSKEAPTSASDQTRSGVQLSGAASFVQAMREAQVSTAIRSDVVIQAQQDVENHTIGSETDYNQAITSLLAEL